MDNRERGGRERIIKGRVQRGGQRRKAGESNVLLVLSSSSGSFDHFHI